MRLFAFQAPIEVDLHGPWPIAISLVLVGLLFVVFVLWLVLRFAAKGRELRHLERMKTLEGGQPIGPSEADKCRSRYLNNVFWVCFWIGAVVPIAATSAASSVMIHTSFYFGIMLAIWICVAVLSIVCVICATTLMIAGRRWSTKGDMEAAGTAKRVSGPESGIAEK
jgi:uncharacterized membrane protein